MNPLAEALGLDPDRLTAIVARLVEREATVATAESLTGGLVTAVLTSVPGSSAAVQGGLVVYASALKVTVAGVNGRALYDYGAVHPFIAEELARGARERCGATYGLGLTGVAGPDPQDHVQPGTVHIGLADDASTKVRTIQVKGDRHAVRSAAVRAALDLLWSALNKKKR